MADSAQGSGHDGAHDADAGYDLEDDDLRIGFFKTWNSLYAAVVIYTIIAIVLLAWMSAAWDFSAGGGI